MGARWASSGSGGGVTVESDPVAGPAVTAEAAARAAAVALKQDASTAATDVELALATMKNQASSSKIVAARLGGTGSTLGHGNPFMTFRNRHVAIQACSDIRLGFSTPLLREFAPTWPVVVRVGLEPAGGGTPHPVTFQGRDFVTLDQEGRIALSDPVPIELLAGDVFYSRVFTSLLWGVYVTLSALANIGDTSVTVSALPGTSALVPQRGYLGAVTLDTGANAEVVTVKDFSGTSAPFTLTLASALTKAHASGATMGHFPFVNAWAYSDLSEATTSGASVATGDLSRSGTVGALNVPTTTLQAGASIGDTTIKLVAPLAAGTSLTVDTAGNAETVTVRTFTGTANPYTAYLTAPLTKAHLSGVTVTGGLGIGFTVRPSIIVADRTVGTTIPAVLGIGDSIVAGTGYGFRNETSWFTLALEGVRPYYNMALAGESAQQFAPLTGRPRRTSSMLNGGWAVYHYGANDVYGSRTLAQFQADCVSIWKALAKRSVKVIAATLTPRTTSTDDWNTTGNQTEVNPGTQGTVRKNYNNWLRAGAPVDPSTLAAVAVGTGGALVAGQAGHPVAFVLEIADTIESARDSGLWKAGAGGPYSADGIHPSSAGHVLMAAALTAVVGQIV